jgi:SagB-type dehydrogenase family enzyme
VAWVVPAAEEQPAAPPDPFHPPETEQDPVARLELKLSRPGIRRDPGAAPVRLPRPPGEDELALRLARRSHREFLETPLAAEHLGALLSCLALAENDGLARYRYASAGGLYPVQAYVWIRPGRVEGLPGGAWYYHPEEHALVPLAPGAALAGEIHAPVNRPIFEGAAFSLFLVGQLRAIAPLYGDVSRDFCLLEAGYMSQLLMTEAAHHGIGLCPVGGYDAGPVRDLLRLDEGHVPLHSLLGGPIDPAWVTAPAGRRPAAAASADFSVELKEHLASRLPAHMIPASFQILDSLPLSANGKVDRRRLPAPDATAGGAVYRPARTELERTLAGLLREVLGI